MITKCSGYRNEKNEVVKCGVLIKDHDSDTKGLLEACKWAKNIITTHLPNSSFHTGGVLDKAIHQAEIPSDGICEACYARTLEVINARH